MKDFEWVAVGTMLLTKQGSAWCSPTWSVHDLPHGIAQRCRCCSSSCGLDGSVKQSVITTLCVQYRTYRTETPNLYIAQAVVNKAVIYQNDFRTRRLGSDDKKPSNRQ